MDNYYIFIVKCNMSDAVTINSNNTTNIDLSLTKLKNIMYESINKLNILLNYVDYLKTIDNIGDEYLLLEFDDTKHSHEDVENVINKLVAEKIIYIYDENVDISDNNSKSSEVYDELDEIFEEFNISDEESLDIDNVNSGDVAKLLIKYKGITD